MSRSRREEKLPTKPDGDLSAHQPLLAGALKSLPWGCYTDLSPVLLLHIFVTPVNSKRLHRKACRVKERRGDSFIILSFSSDLLQVLTLTSVTPILVCCREKQARFHQGMATRCVVSGLKQEMQRFHSLCFGRCQAALFSEQMCLFCCYRANRVTTESVRQNAWNGAKSG